MNDYRCEVRTDFDIIFMYMQMLNLNGVEATKKLRDYEKTHDKKPSTIVALTGNVLLEDKEKALSAGSDVYLTKPLRKAVLIQFVNSYTVQA